mgnify:FL=1|jgi:hypothetical protein
MTEFEMEATGQRGFNWPQFLAPILAAALVLALGLALVSLTGEATSEPGFAPATTASSPR